MTLKTKSLKFYEAKYMQNQNCLKNILFIVIYPTQALFGLVLTHPKVK